MFLLLAVLECRFLCQVKSRMPANDYYCVLNCSNRRNKCPDVSFHGIPANEGQGNAGLWLLSMMWDNTSESLRPILLAATRGERKHAAMKTVALSFRPPHSLP